MTWRILIVDDEPDVRAILRATLEGEYEVLEAHDGLDALEKIERVEPDFVLLDVMMPLMDGFQACEAIRASERFSNVPVMFLSALGSKEGMKKGYGKGANLYLTKPFEPARLKRNIETFFQTNDVTLRRKRYTLEELRQRESEGVPPISPGAPLYASPDDPDSMGVTPDLKDDSWQRALKTEDASDAQPLAERRPAADAPDPTQPMPRIMVIDDDSDIHEIIEIALSHVAEIVHAFDGLEAIQRIVRYQPDMFIIDIMMPKMSGYQLCQSLRSNRALVNTPILMCSAKSTEKDRQFASRMGATDYVTKPFSTADLAARIRTLMADSTFRIRPKTFTIEQIKAQEQKHKQANREDVFGADEALRHGENRTRLVAKPDVDKSTDGKRKRRLFGFGRDK